MAITEAEPAGIKTTPEPELSLSEAAALIPASPPAPAEPQGRLPHFPGLDGMRGLAVVAVLLFHGGFSWAVGGYLGVSTFFTLSGFLITSLLLAERTTTRHIDIGAFWGRRLRRLMPASLGALALAVLFAHFAGTASQQHNLGGDVVSALVDVANWHFIFGHQSYADVFGSPSPVLHFWSLAIEEQFYLIFPLLAFGLLARLRWSRQRFGRVLVGLMTLSLGVTLFAGFSHNHIYLGTETRSFELLMGALLAVLIYSRRVTGRLARPGPHRTAVAVVGAVALTVCVGLWARTPQTADWLYKGGLSGYSFLSAALILATIIPFGPVARVMSNPVLRRVGLYSYGIYVFHWPIFLWINQTQTGLGQWPRFILGVTITWIIAVLSYQHLERPVRRGELPFGLQRQSWAPRFTLAWCIPIGFLIVGGSALAVTAAAPPPLMDFVAAQNTLEHLGAGKPRPKTTVPPVPGKPIVLPVAKVAAFGDSTGLVIGSGINLASSTTGGVEEVTGGAWVGCGLGIGGTYQSTQKADLNGHTSAACDAWPTTYARRINQYEPDLAVVLDAPWDVMDRKIPGDTQWRSFGDPVYDKWFLNEMVRAVDILSSKGARVVWLTSPQVSNIPSRVDRLNQLIKELPTLRPGKITVLDFAGYLAKTDPTDSLRSVDHIHLNPDASVEVAKTWLIPQLEKIWKDLYGERLEALGGASTQTNATTSTTANGRRQSP